MTREWLWFCPWEHGTRENITDESEYMADLWKWNTSYLEGGLEDADASSTHVRSGRFAVKWAQAGFGDNIDFIGDYKTRTKDYLFYYICFKYTGFSATPTVNDDYIIARCCNVKAPGASKNYLALALRVVSASTSSNVNINVATIDGSDGSVLANNVGATAITTGSGYHVAVLRVKISDGTWELWLDGAGSAEKTGTALTNFVHDPRMIPQNLVVTSKASDDGMNIYYDDWGAAHGDSDSDRPGTGFMGILYQPSADVGGQSAWTGTGDTTNKYRNWDDKNDLADGVGDKNTPSSSGQNQMSEFADEASGTIEAARLVWNTGDNPVAAQHNAYGLAGGSYTQIGAGRAGNYWRGIGMPVKHDGGAAWDTAGFNSFSGGIRSTDGATPVFETYLLGWGTALNRPAKTPAPGVDRRRYGLVA